DARREKLLAQGGVGDDGKRTLEASEIIRLARGHEGDGTLCNLWRQGGNGQVGMPLVNQIAVDLVGTDDEVVPQADLCHTSEFIPLPYSAHRVMRIAQEKHPRAVSDGGLEGVKIDPITPVRLLYQRRLVTAEPCIGRSPEDRRIDRGL